MSDGENSKVALWGATLIVGIVIGVALSGQITVKLDRGISGVTKEEVIELLQPRDQALLELFRHMEKLDPKKDKKK